MDTGALRTRLELTEWPRISVRQFHHSCGLYPTSPTLQRCSSICLRNRGTVDAFAVSRVMRTVFTSMTDIYRPNQACPLANTECYCEVFLIADNLPCLDCLALAINSNMTAADLRLDCAENILPNSPNATVSSSQTTPTATGELPLSSGALGSAYTSVIAAASSSSVAAKPPVATATATSSGSVALLQRYPAMWLSAALMFICGLAVLVV